MPNFFDLKMPQQEMSEVKFDHQLRPSNMDEYIGQLDVVTNLKMMITSSQKRNCPLDHLLFFGPPGLGKTSLANLVALEQKLQLHTVSAPTLDKKADLAAILANLAAGDILFIDEIHRLHKSLEEILYSAMEDFRIDLIMGQGPTARTMQIPLRPFTLIGATTRPAMLSRPLRDRFIGQFHFEYYKTDEIARILTLNMNKMSLDLSREAINAISHCSRGTPRVSNRILRRVRDYGIVKDIKIISEIEVIEILRILKIDKFGLEEMDRKILFTIGELYAGGPVGIEALSATLNEDRQTLEDIYEPFLLQNGYLIRTPRGRALSEKGREYWEKFQCKEIII